MPDLPTRRVNRVSPAELPGADGLRTLLVSVVVIAGLYFGRAVLVPITLAVLLSFVLAPLAHRLRRWGLWRAPAVLLSVTLALGVFSALGYVIGSQVASLASRASSYSYVMQRKLDTIRHGTADQITAWQERMGHAAAPPPEGKPKPTDAPKPLPVEVHQPDPTPVEMLRGWVVPLLEPLSSLGIVLVTAVFILLQMEDLRDRLIRLFGSRDLHRTTAAMDDAAVRLSRYFLTQLSVNAGFGLAVGVGLFFIGVPSPALLGVVAGLLRFVPYVGALGAGLLCVGVAAALDPGWAMAVETAALFLVIELLTGQALEPLLYGHRTGLSPVSVVVSAIFWAWLWGPVGLILSMPLTLCLVVLGRHFEQLQFIEVLLGDQPALTPAEGFYQRMLAGDADEVLDQADILLKDRPLSAYYDEVALQGLQMAANDAVRGVLTPEQVGNIQDTVAAVLTDLADRPDAGIHAKAGGGQVGTVLCVGGRGELDELACTLIAQLLGKRGVPARVVSRAGVQRGTIDALDVSGVAVICISWLEASGGLAGLRHVVRRLHARAPGVPCVLGLWQADLGGDTLDRLQAAIAADHYSATLADAVDACVHLASPAVTRVAAVGETVAGGRDEAKGEVVARA